MPASIPESATSLSNSCTRALSIGAVGGSLRSRSPRSVTPWTGSGPHSVGAYPGRGRGLPCSLSSFQPPLP